MIALLSFGLQSFYKEVTLHRSKINKIKILHITNLNEKHNGRLFYNTGRRINNGFVRLGHNVLSLSDRDILFNNKSINDYIIETYLLIIYLRIFYFIL